MFSVKAQKENHPIINIMKQIIFVILIPNLLAYVFIPFIRSPILSFMSNKMHNTEIKQNCAIKKNALWRVRILFSISGIAAQLITQILEIMNGFKYPCFLMLKGGK